MALLFIAIIEYNNYIEGNKNLYRDYVSAAKLYNEKLDPSSYFKYDKKNEPFLIRKLPPVKSKCDLYLLAFIQHLDVYKNDYLIDRNTIKETCKEGGEIIIKYKEKVNEET
jgi:hypothetical protein